MLYVINTREWVESEVEEQCKKHGVEFRNGFFWDLTKIKLASKLLKTAVAEEHGISLALLKSGKNGKPEFEGLPVHFNISHHGHIAIAVTSASQPVGIDVTDSVSPFSDEELLKLFTALPATYHQGFYWAAREAYLKYTGDGSSEMPISIKPPSHSAVPDLYQMNSLSVMPLIRIENQFARLFKVDDFVGAVIAPLPDLSEVQFFSTDKD